MNGHYVSVEFGNIIFMDRGGPQGHVHLTKIRQITTNPVSLKEVFR
jgi:hypothetical protein